MNHLYQLIVTNTEKIRITAETIRKGDLGGLFANEQIEFEDLMAAEGAILLDVRAVPEWESLQLRLEHHLRVLWIPTHEVPDRLDEIPRDRVVGVFCTNGPRSAMVYLYLRSHGYEQVRIAPSNYEAITSLLLPGKLLKHLKTRDAAGQED